MEPLVQAITWEAPEHHHNEKGGDWFFVLAILIVSFAVAALLLVNTLFALLIGVSGVALAISAARKPSIIAFAVSVRGIRIEDRLYPYTTLRAYHIDEDGANGPQLLILSKHRFIPLFVIPLPAEYIDDIEDIMAGKIAEQHLEEPLFMKVLERFGF